MQDRETCILIENNQIKPLDFDISKTGTLSSGLERCKIAYVQIREHSLIACYHPMIALALYKTVW